MKALTLIFLITCYTCLAVKLKKLNSTTTKDKGKLVRHRNWIDVRLRLPKQKGVYTVWISSGISGKKATAEFDGEKFPSIPQVLEWMDGYKEA